MKKLIFCALALLALPFTACKKENNGDGTSNIGSFTSNNRNSEKQNFTINLLDAFTYIEGAKGTKITILGGSFVDQNGNSVTGSADVELIELLDYQDMIKSGMSTVSDNQVLVSGGQIKLTVSQNGNNLKLAPGYSIDVMIPTDSVDYNMGLFVGNEDSDGNVVWTSAAIDTNQQDSVINTQDSTGTDYFYFEFDNPNLGWINCDYFWNQTPVTDVIATLGTNYNIINTRAYLVIPAINSVLQCYTFVGGNNAKWLNIAEGTYIELVVVSEINGDYFLGTGNGTVTTGYTTNITMNPSTLTDINNYISNL